MIDGQRGIVGTLALQSETDLMLASKDALLAIMFCKSSSPNYQMAVAVAKSAQGYSDGEFCGRVLHFVLFGKTHEEAVKAKSLASYVGQWKGSQVFAGGKTAQTFYEIFQVLDCYLTASACRDPKSHCHVVTPEYEIHPDDIKDGPFIFPCRHLQSWQFHDINRNHPSTIQDQLQAAAIHRGCDWCPNFNSADLTKFPLELRMPIMDPKMFDP